VANIPVGTARNGHVEIALAAQPDLSGLTLTRANGTLEGDGLQVHWLRPVPPIESGQAQLRIIDPDTLEVNPAVLRDIVRRFDNKLALDAEVVRGGTIHAGDAVTISECFYGPVTVSQVDIFAFSWRV